VDSLCLGGICRTPGTCTDTALNQDETDTDCGGTVCPACPDGQGCEVGADCQSGLCAAQVCTAPGGSCTDTADCTCDSYGGHDYWFCRLQERGDVSPTTCATVGMTLARVDDSYENDWLVQQGTTHGLYAVSTLIVMGANQMNTAPDWVWPDGEPFWTGPKSGTPLNGLYNNWSSQAPRSSFACAAILQTGLWLDQSCGSAQPFVCETP
jgi:hypothetical protein